MGHSRHARNPLCNLGPEEGEFGGAKCSGPRGAEGEEERLGKEAPLHSASRSHERHGLREGAPRAFNRGGPRQAFARHDQILKRLLRRQRKHVLGPGTAPSLRVEPGCLEFVPFPEVLRRQHLGERARHGTEPSNAHVGREGGQRAEGRKALEQLDAPEAEAACADGRRAIR